MGPPAHRPAAADKCCSRPSKQVLAPRYGGGVSHGPHRLRQLTRRGGASAEPSTQPPVAGSARRYSGSASSNSSTSTSASTSDTWRLISREAEARLVDQLSGLPSSFSVAANGAHMSAIESMYRNALDWLATDSSRPNADSAEAHAPRPVPRTRPSFVFTGGERQNASRAFVRAVAASNNAELSVSPSTRSYAEAAAATAPHHNGDDGALIDEWPLSPRSSDATQFNDGCEYVPAELPLRHGSSARYSQAHPCRAPTGDSRRWCETAIREFPSIVLHGAGDDQSRLTLADLQSAPPSESIIVQRLRAQAQQQHLRRARGSGADPRRRRSPRGSSEIFYRLAAELGLGEGPRGGRRGDEALRTRAEQNGVTAAREVLPPSQPTMAATPAPRIRASSPSPPPLTSGFPPAHFRTDGSPPGGRPAETRSGLVVQSMPAELEPLDADASIEPLLTEEHRRQLFRRLTPHVDGSLSNVADGETLISRIYARGIDIVDGLGDRVRSPSPAET